MSLLDILLAALIIAAIVLIVFVIKFLKDLTESLKTTVDSVKSLEHDIEEIKNELTPTLKNINEITEKGAELTARIETDYSFVGSLIANLKEVFAKDKNNPKSVEVSEERINETIKNLKAISKGARTFLNTLRNRKS